MRLHNVVAEKVSESKMYEYKCELDRVVDGDTVDVDIDLGFGVWLKKERVRIMGIDTPESRTSDPIEKIFGKAASARLKELIEHDCILCTTKDRSGEDERGKFGRVLGDFKLADGRMVTDVLIGERHAVGYHGGSKNDMVEQHMANRKFLIAGGIVTLPE